MSKINSKQKGSRFERVVCKVFSKWTGFEFQRVPQSGGLRWKKADNITSDVTCTDPRHGRRCLISIECKSYQDIRFEHILLQNKSCKILSFWEQASGDASRANKVPFLVMHYNGMPKEEAFVMVNNSTAKLMLSQGKLTKPRMAIQWNNYEQSEDVLYVFMLSDLINLDYKVLHKELRKLHKANNK